MTFFRSSMASCSKRTLLQVVVLAAFALATSVVPTHARAQIFSALHPGTSPSLLSMSNVSTGGGETDIVGANLPVPAALMICTHPCGAGPWTALSVLSSPTPTSTGFSARVPSLPAGSYDALISAPDGGLAFQPSILQITATSDPSVVCGSNLKIWYRSDSGITCGGSACANAGAVDQWTDKSGNGHTLTASGSARPTYNTVATFVPSGVPTYPSVTFDGVNQLLKNTTTDVASSTAFYMWIVAKDLAGTANKIWFGVYDSGLNRWALGTGTTASTPGFWASAAISATFSSTISGAQQVYGGAFGSSGSYTTAVSAQNGTAVAGSSSQAYAAGNGTISLGGSNSTAQGNVEVVEAFGCNLHPTSAQLFSVAQYLNLRYFNSSPTFARSTTMYRTGTGFRVQGSGFVSGMTVSFGGGLGVSDQTATLLSSSRIEVPMPGTSLVPGSYPVTLTNPDGGSLTETGGLVISGNASATPMTATGDLSCVGWYDLSAGNYTTSTGVSGLIDQSLRGNDLAQGTAANQPLLNASDAAFAGHNSMSFDGTQTYVITSGNFDFGTTTALDIWGVVNADSANSNQGWWLARNGVGLFNFLSKPRTAYGGNTATWAATLGGATHETFSDVPIGTSVSISIDVDNGTAVTATSSPATATSPVAIGANSSVATFAKGKAAAFAVFNRTLTSSEQSNLRTLGQTYGSP